MVTAQAAPVANPTVIKGDVETTPVLHTKDSADDPSIWVDPTNGAQSLVIGNDKQGALEVYNLDGSLRQRVTSGTTAKWGNVDVRQGVTVGTTTMDVVPVMNGQLRVYTVNPATRMLTSVTDGTGLLNVGGGEGLCAYDSPTTGQVYVFVITRPGRVRQYVLTDPDNDGLVTASLVREFSMGSESEGCVVDDANQALYISQEDVALWRYGAEPSSGTTRTSIDDIGPTGHLVSDIEGSTLATVGSGGYLIVSAQYVAKPKLSYFVVYDRVTNAYVGAFRVGNGTVTDGCERTDGVAAYAGDLGPTFPHGMFVCQDNFNSAPGVGNQDFKLVNFDKVLAAIGG